MPVMAAGAGLAVLALLFNAASWGLSWWPFRLLLERGVHPLWSTSILYGVSTLVLTLWRPRAWRELARAPVLGWLALASGLTNAGFNWGVTIGDVTRVVLLFYLMPVWTVFLAWWLLGERPGAGIVLRVMLALGGAALVLTEGQGVVSGGAGWHPADGLGLLGGLAFALNNVMLRREARRPESARALAMFLGGCALSGLVAATGAAGGWGAGQVSWPPLPAWAWIGPVVALSLVFLGSNLALQYGASRLPANVTSVVMPAEVVFASVSAVWWGGASWSLTLVAGGGLILLATVLAAWQKPGA